MLVNCMHTAQVYGCCYCVWLNFKTKLLIHQKGPHTLNVSCARAKLIESGEPVKTFWGAQRDRCYNRVCSICAGVEPISNAITFAKLISVN